MIQELFGQEEQIKTCRKLQHVKRYMERNVSKIIRCLTAVGKNYNSTRDTKMFEEDYCFSCSRNDRFPLANYKNSCVTLWSSTWNDCTFDSYFLHRRNSHLQRYIAGMCVRNYSHF